MKDSVYPQKILLTGAAGGLGQVAARHLGRMLRRGDLAGLRMADINPMEEVEGAEIVQTPISERDVIFDLVEDMDAVIHLSGISGESDWASLIPSNLAATAHLWDAAFAHGTDRILFASSNHAVGMYPVEQRIDDTAAPRPDSRYGLTKAFGEQLGALYAVKTPVRSFCMRIGSCFAQVTARRHLKTFQSHADFLRMIETGLTADYRHEVVYGISDNDDSFWDNRNALRLGYTPRDKPQDFLAEEIDQTEHRLQGGEFPDLPLSRD
ncbi:uronate dehydrogenase [Paracoccus isoporae]|uniref:Uronate dehydrogenase n=1 Tax=Paracoccus isoporae TaxID=591205 RepID=A0A1G7DCX2_9RHOB|nr:NAD(P)-dependent oxidoreductase [Paracoccus isoporae]SDE49319.1 uronate dehydrogenase [Paracoccus isoporae]